MDLFDRASEAEALFRDQALAAVAARMPAGSGTTHCRAADCGIEIPPERRAALPGVEFCVDCQQRRERLGR